MENLTTDKITQKNPKREKLKEISKFAKSLQETEYPDLTINEILIDVIYQRENGERLTFDTFNGWRKRGKRVRKGEKAYLIWGKKREVPIQEAQEGDNDSFKFFPMAFVFSNEQVESYAVHEDSITGFEDLDENE